MNEVVRGWWAIAYANTDFVCVETCSGYRGAVTDSKGKQLLMKPDAGNEELGLAVMDAFSKSRWVLGIPREGSVYPPGLEFDADLYDYKKNIERYAQWVKALMTRYNYKTKRALFKDLQNCGIESKNGLIKITPMRRSGAEGWEGLGKGTEGIVEIPATSTPTEIGTALRLAFSRCTG